MPKATVTVRELKNKDTKIDLSVTGYRELPGLMRSTFEYQIVVVSSLSCFKLPSHKDSDVVQFTLFKKFAEVEDLRAKLNETFAGTVFPPLIKKSIIVNDAVIKERRNSIDSFMKFLSGMPRIVTSGLVLTFLGIEAGKVKRFASGDTEDSAAGKAKDEENREDDDEAKNEQREGNASSSLFDDEDDDEDGADFLAADTVTADDDEDFFSSADTRGAAAANARLFESQDLKRELTEEDEKDFTFVEDAIITKKEAVKVSGEDEEENDDLLNVDEDIDLDTLLTLDTKAEKPPTPSQDKPKPVPRTKPQPPEKPAAPSKPKPGLKPATADKPKPKPRIAAKPTAARPSQGVAGNAPPPAKPQTQAAAESTETGKPAHKVEKPDLSSDDIMQYIAANAEEDEASLDLFS